MIPNLVTRKKWRARPRRARTLLRPDAVRYLVVHYSGMDADEQSQHAKCAARVRGIQNFHMDVRGWSDIAYNWVVCRHGFVFQGRGWRVRSAATGDANAYTVAVCFLGNDSAGRDDVTLPAAYAIRNVLAFVERNANDFFGTRGHRNFMRTACPGDELMSFVAHLNYSRGLNG